MSKLVSGMPSVNSQGNIRSDYSLIKVLTTQVQQMLNVVKTKSAAYEAQDGEIVLMTSGSIADVTVTLPAVATNSGAQITIIKVDAGTKKVLIDGTSSETINGAAGQELATQWAKMTVYCDGAAWYIIA